MIFEIYQNGQELYAVLRATSLAGLRNSAGLSVSSAAILTA